MQTALRACGVKTRVLSGTGGEWSGRSPFAKFGPKKRFKRELHQRQDMVASMTRKAAEVTLPAVISLLGCGRRTRQGGGTLEVVVGIAILRYEMITQVTPRGVNPTARYRGA